MWQAQKGGLTASREHANAHQDRQERPLGGYAVVLAAFATPPTSVRATLSVEL